MRKRRRRSLRKLTWLVNGAVWAIDGTWFDSPVASLGRRALVVVELNTKGVLTMPSVSGEKVKEVLACLRELIARHGAPLVLKLDNGSGFVADEMTDFCRENDITLLFSPPRRPSYNGTCEVSVRWSKERVEAAAAARGEPGGLLPADLEHAVTYQGVMPRVDQETRRRFLATVAEQRRAVAAEWGLALRGPMEDHVRRSLERVAVQRALQLCHILKIEGRGYRWSLRARKAS
jgi:transposase InsO family protein